MRPARRGEKVVGREREGIKGWLVNKFGFCFKIIRCTKRTTLVGLGRARGNNTVNGVEAVDNHLIVIMKYITQV